MAASTRTGNGSDFAMMALANARNARLSEFFAISSSSAVEFDPARICAMRLLFLAVLTPPPADG